MHGCAQFLQIVFDVAHERVEVPVQVSDLHTEVFVDIHPHRLLNDQLLVAVLDQSTVQRLVFPDQIIDPDKIIGQAGRRKGRRLVTNDDTTASAFDVECFPNVVHDVGVHNGCIANQKIGFVIGPQSTLFSACPLLTAVGPEVDDCVGLVLLAYPQVGGKIKVVQRHLRVVVDLRFIAPCCRTFTAHRLWHHQKITQLHAWNDEACDPVLPCNPVTLLRFAPILVHTLSHRIGQSGEPPSVDIQWEEVPVRRFHQRVQCSGAVAGAQHGTYCSDDVGLHGAA